MLGSECGLHCTSYTLNANFPEERYGGATITLIIFVWCFGLAVWPRGVIVFSLLWSCCFKMWSDRIGTVTHFSLFWLPRYTHIKQWLLVRSAVCIHKRWTVQESWCFFYVLQSNCRGRKVNEVNTNLKASLIKYSASGCLQSVTPGCLWPPVISKCLCFVPVSSCAWTHSDSIKKECMAILHHFILTGNKRSLWNVKTPIFLYGSASQPFAVYLHFVVKDQFLTFETTGPDSSMGLTGATSSVKIPTVYTQTTTWQRFCTSVGYQ